ncbi:MAG: DUF1636 domain-containing protein [Gammaproteobacteria bacterium]|nr:DUF1636 domain-containing protein [Gammaproteobacteria bacterium]
MADRQEIRGGTRLADALRRASYQNSAGVQLRGVRCMSQCKRPCVISLTAPGAFTYVFGDLDPEDAAHVQAILDLLPLYQRTPEGFMARNARPEPLRASILGRLPPIGSQSSVISSLEKHYMPCAARSGR